MGALQDDEPQFEELTGSELEQARGEYRRVWGEEMPTPGEPQPESK